MTYIIAYVKTQKNKIHNPLCQTYNVMLSLIGWVHTQNDPGDLTLAGQV